MTMTRTGPAGRSFPFGGAAGQGHERAGLSPDSDIPEIAGERILLRALRPSDAGLLALYCGDPRVARMTTSIPHPYPPGASEDFIAATARPDAGAVVWAIDGTRSQRPELVGTVALRAAEGERELGYWVAPPVWRKGIATEAVRLLSAANPLGDRSWIASVFHDNPASAAVLDRCGFVETGGDRAFSVARGEAVERRRFKLVLR